MVVCYQISEIQKYLSQLHSENHSVGFVPTMGAIHDGHLKLLSEARRDNDSVISSIFVNPIQFNNSEDYDNYPRDIDKDLALMKEAQCDAVFIPSVDEMYPQESVVEMNFGPLERGLEGDHRPGHFNGVGIVLSKLFNILRPDKAYFGQKDLQQAAIISKISEDLFFGIEIKIVSTMREDDGLAFSSRNQRLDKEQRKDAVRFYFALKSAQKSLLQKQSIEEVTKEVTNYINERDDMDLDYFAVVDSQTLKPIKEIDIPNNISLCIAGYVGDIRLLDNIYLNED